MTSLLVKRDFRKLIKSIHHLKNGKLSAFNFSPISSFCFRSFSFVSTRKQFLTASSVFGSATPLSSSHSTSLLFQKRNFFEKLFPTSEKDKEKKEEADLKQTVPLRPSNPKKLSANDVSWTCPTSLFDFDTTADNQLPFLDGIIGQNRAKRILEVGLKIRKEGYNIFVTGFSGSGRTWIVEQLLKQLTENEEFVPPDHLFAFNFSNPDIPLYLTLPGGLGETFKKDFYAIMKELKRSIVTAFESESYISETELYRKQSAEKVQSIMSQVQTKAFEKGFTLEIFGDQQYSPILIKPILNGQIITFSELDKLIQKKEISTEEAEKFFSAYNEVVSELTRGQNQVKNVIRQSILDQEERDKNFILPFVSHSITELSEKYNFPKIEAYLNQVKENILKDFKFFQEKEMDHIPLQYQVNLIVNNSGQKKRPIIVENHPTYKNIFGTIEKSISTSGLWNSNFTNIKSGSLLRANGGFLIINALDLFLDFGVWTTLVRTLRSNSLEIQNQDWIFGSSAMKPQSIDIDVKVLLIGDLETYELLCDNDFPKIFKVRADFDNVEVLDNPTILKFAQFIKTLSSQEKLLPFDKYSIGKIVEYAVKKGGKQNKISVMMSESVSDVVREADFWARLKGDTMVRVDHIKTALQEIKFRNSFIEEKLLESIQEGQIFIDTKGKKCGQINSLYIISSGTHEFASVARVTASTNMGKSGIINIEREAGFSGHTHNKGVLILSGYFREKYGSYVPLTLDASICFEQSYFEVDGDSASSTELYALISSISKIPARQGIAVTGSVNQKGEIQPIGGVNEKIEAFYSLCKKRGLTGDQGVIIPLSNKINLNLPEEIVESIAKNQFHIYPVQTIDEGLEILLETKAGKNLENSDSVFEVGSVNWFVLNYLHEMHSRMQSFQSENENEESS